MADFDRLNVRCPYIAFIPQWDFLNFLTRKAKQYARFHLLMETEAIGLLSENGKIAGVRAKNKEGEFDIEADESVDSLLNEYEVACALSREICINFKLDDPSKRPYRGDHSPSLRWIYLHMIEEIARHNGHLDIYRELLDGTTDRE